MSAYENECIEVDGDLHGIHVPVAAVGHGRRDAVGVRYLLRGRRPPRAADG